MIGVTVEHPPGWQPPTKPTRGKKGEAQTETLRSGHVVRTVRCKTCAGNVRIKLG